MYGRGGRIGLVVLDNDYCIEGDLRRLLPEDVEVHTSRVMYPHSVTVESLATAQEGLAHAMRALHGVHPATIVFACTSGSFYAGREGHERMLERMRAVAGTAAVTTASGSVIAALSALGVARPAVGSPYSPEINQRLDRFLREHGFDPHPAIGLFPGEVDDDTLQDVEEDKLEQFLLGLDRPDCDAIVMSCTGMPTARVVPRVERRIGKPVVTSNVAILWNAMRLGGITSPPVLSCRLFEVAATRAARR